MQKQVEVRMDESHLEPRVEKPESACSSLCDKIMNNMVLTLTILGKFLALLYFHSQSIYYNPPLSPFLVLGSLESFSACIWQKKRSREHCTHTLRRGDKHIYTYGRLTLAACLWIVERARSIGRKCTHTRGKHTSFTWGVLSLSNTGTSCWEAIVLTTEPVILLYVYFLLFSEKRFTASSWMLK